MTFTHTFALPGINLPALCAGNPDHHSVVVVLHGLGCYKETQEAELERLGAAGFFAVAVDAPHHGVRSDNAMEVFRDSDGFEGHHFMLASVLQHASEIAGLVEELRKKYKKVAVMGISMGGYTAFALLRYANRPDLLAGLRFKGLGPGGLPGGRRRPPLDPGSQRQSLPGAGRRVCRRRGPGRHDLGRGHSADCRGCDVKHRFGQISILTRISVIGISCLFRIFTIRFPRHAPHPPHL